MTNIFKGEHYYDEAKAAKRGFHPLVTLLLFFLVFWVMQFITGIVISAAGMPVFTEYMSGQGITDMDPITLSIEYAKFIVQPPEQCVEKLVVIQLLSTVISAAAAIIFCRFIEGRSLRSMGFVKKGAALNYLVGLAIGAAAFSAAVLIVVLSGNASFAGAGAISSPLWYALIVLGWVLQGAQEEIICRGWLMNSLSAKLPVWAAVVINSAFFSLMHLFNSGFALLAALNIFLVGVMLSLFAIRFNNIYICCAIHSVWNWIQGNFYGLPVSGMNTGSSVLRFELGENELWTGGSFGVESGLGATIVCAVVIALLIFVPAKRMNNAENAA